MDMDDQADRAISSLYDARGQTDEGTRQLELVTAQVRALLSVAAAIRDLANATRGD